MKKNTLIFRRVVALLIFLLVAPGLLESCSDNATPVPSTNSPTTSPAGTVAPTVAVSSGETSTTSGVRLNKNVSGNIEFWHIWSSPVRRIAIRRVIAICQAQLPNIKIRDIYKPFGDIWTQNTAAVAAGTGVADVIVEDRPKLATAASNNIESSLQKYATRDGVDSSAFWPFAWKETLYNNETYGIPFEADVRVLFWNKNAFREAGLDPEKPPKTWSELEEYAAKLDKKNQDGAFERYGFMPLINGNWELWSDNNGAELVRDGKVQANGPKVVETLNWLKKWVDRYGGWPSVQAFRSNFQAAPQDAFMGGKVAMLVDINGYASGLNFYRPQYLNKDGKKENMEWGVAPIPPNANAKSTGFSGGFALSIPRGAKNPDAAWEFIKCATGPEAQLSWARDTYAMPTRPDVANSSQLLADPAWQVMVNSMSTIAPSTYVKEYANWVEQVEKRVNEVYEGKTDPKTALDQAQQAIETEIAKNKK